MIIREEIQHQSPGETDTQSSDEGNLDHLEPEGEIIETKWIILCIPYWGIVKVIYLPCPEEKDDKTLFNVLRRE